MGPGFRHIHFMFDSNTKETDFLFTGIVEFENYGENGCKYTASVLHASEENKEKHEQIGFKEGWGKALDQLIAFVKMN